jgi:hypothetical protein
MNSIKVYSPQISRGRPFNIGKLFNDQIRMAICMVHRLTQQCIRLIQYYHIMYVFGAVYSMCNGQEYLPQRNC